MNLSSRWRKRLFRLLRPKNKLLRALRALSFRAALTAAALVCCALPPTLVVGGLALATPTASMDAQGGEADAGQPHAGQASADESRTEQPRAEQPRTGESRTGYPRAEQPRTGESRTGYPRVEQPRTGQQGANEPPGSPSTKGAASHAQPDLSIDFSSDTSSTSDHAVAPLADVERSELARARAPLNSAVARILAEGNARMSALAAAADALPNRRDIRMGAISADERLALVAQIYRPKVRYHEDGAPTVTILLQASPEAGDNISQALRSADLVQLRLRLLQETADLLQLMNARDPAENGTVTSSAGSGNNARIRGSGDLGNVYRAPVGMHDAADGAKPGTHGGDTRKNALDEVFSGRAGAGAQAVAAGVGSAAAAFGSANVGAAAGSVNVAAGSSANVGSAATGAANADVAAAGSVNVAAGSSANVDSAATGAANVGAAAAGAAEPSLADVVWTERHWNKASRQLQALLQAQDYMESDPEGWLVPDGFLPRLEQVSARLPQSPSAWLLLAEAQLRRGLPLQSIASCDAALALDSGLNRARYIRALGYWRLQQLALAENDLTSSLDDRHGFTPQGEDRARRLRARGAVRMQRHDMTGMCEDFGAACALGECEALILARAQRHCLPPAPAEAQGSAKTRQENTPASPEGRKSGASEAASSPAAPLLPSAGTKEVKP